MRIDYIELGNFKFYHELQFLLQQENCLIYGENGTGKSSIYEALYSNFYYFKNKEIGSGRLDIRETYRHRDYPSEDMIINILFDNEESLNRTDNDLENHELLNDKVIYFANERVLREITEENFYDVLKNILQEHFPLLTELFKGYTELERKLRRGNTDNLIKERLELDEKFRIEFHETIPLYVINSILQNDFDEKFEIEFKIENSRIENKELIYPIISIAVKGIDDRGNFKNHFNEAKLKLIGIAIYFALAKKYETDSELKLLVLDDFLTSLDMANRKLIVQYILDNFGEYQKIILTHNIQFYNMIVRLLDMKNEKDSWDIKKIFLSRINDDSISEIRDKKSFLNQAKDRLIEGDLSSSGNFLRKEFERIIHEFEILLELGKVEDLSNILDILKEPRVYFSNPHKTIEEFVQSLESTINLPVQVSDEEKLFKIGEKIEKLRDCKIDLTQSETLTDGTIQQHPLLLSLQKTNFYNGIILNPLSHDDTEIEAYRKECINIIKLLTSLNKGLTHLKGKKYK